MNLLRISTGICLDRFRSALLQNTYSLSHGLPNGVIAFCQNCDSHSGQWPRIRSSLNTLVSLWRLMHQLFSVHTTAKEFKNATIIGHFGFVFAENSGQRYYKIIMTPVSKSAVFKVLSVHTKTKSRRFQIPPVSRVLSQSYVFGTD